MTTLGCGRFEHEIEKLKHPKVLGLAEVAATEPPCPKKGEFWLDTATSGPDTSHGVRNVTTATANTTLDITNDVVRVDASSGAVTITLPTAATRRGKQYDIKKIDSSVNAVTVDANGSETMDGNLTISTTVQYHSFTLISPDIGTDWGIY